MRDEMAVPLIDDQKLDKKINKKYSEDIEEENEKEDNDKEIIEKNKNNLIISKIYFMFFIQLGISYLFIYQAFNNKSFFNLVKNDIKLLLLAIILTAIIFVCSYQWKFILILVPFNYFFFLVFTLSISFIICRIVILLSFKLITVLWILILIMILSLSIYAYNSIKKIKIIEAFAFTSLILISFGFILFFVTKINLMDILLILFCLICFCVYLIYDVNSIIKDKNINKKNYILVNFYLYTDIFRIFMKMVKVVYTHLRNALNKDENEILQDMSNINDQFEKSFEDIEKTFGKKDKGDDEDEDEDSNKKKKKEKGKKEKSKKKDDKKKEKKEDKIKGDKKDSKKKKRKAKKDDVGDLLEDGKKVGEFLADIFSNN